MITIKNALANLVQTAILNFKMATKNRNFSPYFGFRDSRDLILVSMPIF